MLNEDSLPKYNGMAVRSTTSGDNRFYNPERDLSYVAGRVIPAIKSAFTQERWPDILNVFNKTGDEADNLWNSFCDAHDSYVQMLNLSVSVDEDGKSLTMQQLIEASKWNDLPKEAAVGYLSLLGHVMTAYFVAALRSESFSENGTSPIEDAVRIAKEGRLAFMGISASQDAQAIFSDALIHARRQDVSWEQLERIMRREKNLEA